MSRAAERRESRMARKLARQAAKLERQANRQAGRSGRAKGRQGVRATAYETGNNPNAFISDIVSTVGATAVGLKGGGAKPGGIQGKSASSDVLEDLQDNPVKAIGLALVLGLVAKKAGLF